MCNLMVVGLKFSQTSLLKNQLIAWDIAKKVGIIAYTNGLGVNFQLHSSIRPDLVPFLKQMNINIKPVVGNTPIEEIAFELVAGSLGTCICNAIPNDSTQPDPHPELSGIYKFLDELFKIKGIKKVIIYFGEYYNSQGKDLPWKIPIIKEKPKVFLNHFITDNTDDIIGIGKWGIFNIKP